MDKWLWLFRSGLKGLIIRRPKRAGNFLHSSSTCESYDMILLRVLPEVLVKRPGCVLTGLPGVTLPCNELVIFQGLSFKWNLVVGEFTGSKACMKIRRGPKPQKL